jgi:hypothetical protein
MLRSFKTELTVFMMHDFSNVSQKIAQERFRIWWNFTRLKTPERIKLLFVFLESVQKDNISLRFI